ncbi:Spliceosome B complex MFAP1 [Hyphodiscus hymeniophilus]|uniref:Spliceosome B complex MFAP1 n=1 Tax=Hyphodiscus hymeniophilus TaxID=353542 RepID=A0A9P6VJ11_9HELO|nr:Spliceosome B complex MFAP1 [Hyphodiscus hymeniophilus]
MPPKRMTANPVKASRHRPGKVLHEDSDSDIDSAPSEAEESKPISAPPKASTAGAITSNLSKVDLNARRKEAATKEAQRIEDEKAARLKEEEGFVTASEEESEEEGSEEESEEEESESEEEAPRRVMAKPMFIKKGQRNGTAATKVDERTDEELIAAEEERRRKAADEIVEEQIRKDLAAKEAGKKNWDDEEEEDEVDDTDGIDPEAEYAAWKLRELKRIKRDREVIEEKEKELAEVERRKNLTEEERNAEDEEFIARQKEEKDGKGKMGYMQKYFHKGAFFQDDAKAEGLDKRDIMGARFTDDVNRELLPQALQMRDMTKLGKKGATKYRDLKSEDTGKWGQFDDRRPGKSGPGGFNTDERFMPDRDRGGPSGGSGANNMPVGERKRVNGAPEGPRAMQDGGGRPRSNDGGDKYRPGRDERSRSRSRSPRRYHDDRRRKRSSSRDKDRYESDKRRRVDSR